MLFLIYHILKVEIEMRFYTHSTQTQVGRIRVKYLKQSLYNSIQL